MVNWWMIFALSYFKNNSGMFLISQVSILWRVFHNLRKCQNETRRDFRKYLYGRNRLRKAKLKMLKEKDKGTKSIKKEPKNSIYQRFWRAKIPRVFKSAQK